MKPEYRIALLTSVGGLFEMYDFVIYVMLATIIAKLFFPPGHPELHLILVFAIFAAGYLTRPLGGLFFGHFADRYGRKKSLMITIIAMAFPTVLIGVMPTYQTIGVAAPIILLILRIIQGLSVGGDLPSSGVFLAEHAPNATRGRVTSFLYWGINFGIFLGGFITAIVAHSLSHANMLRFGWRLPFLIGIVLAVIGYYIRRSTVETSIFLEMSAQQHISRIPLLDVFKNFSRRIVIGVGITTLMAAIIGTVFLYMPVYLHIVTDMKLKHALTLNTYSILIFSLLIPVFGALSDALGRRKIMAAGAVLFILFSYGIYALLNYPSLWALWLTFIILDVISAMVIGPIVSALCELFPTKVRTSGFAVTYNIAFAIFCGLAPIILTQIHFMTRTIYAPAFYLIVTGLITLISLIAMRDTTGRDLHHS